MKISILAVTLAMTGVGQTQMNNVCLRAESLTKYSDFTQNPIVQRVNRCGMDDLKTYAMVVGQGAGKAIEPLTIAVCDLDHPCVVSGSYFGAWDDRIMTCGGSEDGQVKNCKIEEGHTLDEAINNLLESNKQQQKYQDERYRHLVNEYSELLDSYKQYIQSVKGALAAIREALHPKPQL